MARPVKFWRRARALALSESHALRHLYHAHGRIPRRQPMEIER